MVRTGPIQIALVLLSMYASWCGVSSERESDHVPAPSGPWREAYVQVRDGPAFSKNGRRYPPHVTHTLIIVPRNAWQPQVQLVHETRRTIPEQSFDALRDTDYSLRFAPDAHALAVSSDGRRSWRLVDLTVPNYAPWTPFWCVHRGYRDLSPWPSSPALALEILAATDPSSPAARVHGALAPITWPARVRPDRAQWLEELEGATRYACARRDDPELRAAVIEAFFRLEGTTWPEGGSHLSTCVGELAREDPALRARLEAAAARESADSRRAQSALSIANLPP